MDTLINHFQLVDLLRSLEQHGTTIVSLAVMTDARARKTGNPYPQALKLCYVNGLYGYSYSNALAKVDDAPVKSRSWGRHVSRGLIEHDGKMYVSIRVRKVITSPVYFARENDLLKQIDAAELAPFLPPIRAEKVSVRDYCFDSIVALKVNSLRYKIIHPR